MKYVLIFSLTFPLDFFLATLKDRFEIVYSRISNIYGSFQPKPYFLFLIYLSTNQSKAWVATLCIIIICIIESGRDELAFHMTLPYPW